MRTEVVEVGEGEEEEDWELVREGAGGRRQEGRGGRVVWEGRERGRACLSSSELQ